jgi:hypothetical protein
MALWDFLYSHPVQAPRSPFKKEEQFFLVNFYPHQSWSESFILKGGEL